MDRPMLDQAVGLAGLSIPSEQRVDWIDRPPVLPSRLRLDDGASALQALIGSAASSLWELRAGRRQDVMVDPLLAVASLSSGRFCTVDGMSAEQVAIHPPAAPRGHVPTTGFFQCRDGRWIHLQSEFPRLVEGLLGLLECDDDAASVTTAVAGWNALDLEDALAERGLCGAMARTYDEWLAHPQGALLETLPAVVVERIGDGPIRPLDSGGRTPLSGIRVIDATRVLAGPTVGRTLASLGADVLHIASPSLVTMQVTEVDTGHGKRQAFVDLKTPTGQAELNDLLGDADVFSQSFRAGKFAALGLTREALAARRPGLIQVSVNCYGPQGEWAGRPGWEQLAQSATGTALVDDPERPALTGVAANDYGTGFLGAIGVMEALRRRAIEGGSWSVSVSLCQTSMWYLRMGIREAAPDSATGLDGASAFLEEHESAYGRVRHLKPGVMLSETPPAWSIPTSPLGSGRAEWASAGR